MSIFLEPVAVILTSHASCLLPQAELEGPKMELLGVLEMCLAVDLCLTPARNIERTRGTLAAVWAEEQRNDEAALGLAYTPKLVWASSV